MSCLFTAQGLIIDCSEILISYCRRHHRPIPERGVSVYTVFPELLTNETNSLWHLIPMQQHVLLQILDLQPIKDLRHDLCNDLNVIVYHAQMGIEEDKDSLLQCVTEMTNKLRQINANLLKQCLV